MKTAIELLQKLETHLRKLRPLVFNTACADDSDGEHLSAALHIADDLRNLTALKSLEGQRLTVDEAIAAIDAEPELPDDMPDEMWDACRKDRDTMQEALRVVVRLTKEGITNRLTKSANP